MDLDCAAQLGYASGNVAATLFPWFVGGWLLNVYGLWRLVRRDMLTWTHGLAGAIPGLLFGQSLRPGKYRCPFCAERIRVETQVCRYCQRDLPAGSSQEIAP